MFRPLCVIACLAGALGVGAQQDQNWIANPGFESLNADQPDRWDHFVEEKPGATARVDDIAHGGSYAVWLHTPTPYEREPVNNWSQNVIAQFGGKTLRLRGFIRVAEAKEAALWLQCWRKSPWGVLKAASTSIDTPVYGTKDWQEVSMDVAVPEGTDFVTVRCVLLGAGSAWFDDLSLTEVAPPPAEQKKTQSDEKTAKADAAGTPPPLSTEPATTDRTSVEALPVPSESESTNSAASVSPEEASRQEAAVMPLVTQLENEVKRLRDANLILTDTLQQIQQVNQGLVEEMLAVQAELQSLKKKDASEAAAPALETGGKRLPPLIPLSEAVEQGAP